MAERAPRSHEQQKTPEASHEQKEHLKEQIESGEKTKHEAKDSLDKIRSSIEKETAKTELKKPGQEEQESSTKGTKGAFLDRTVKKSAYKKELHRIQGHLPKVQRQFSKVIHNSTVEAVSEVSGKTVARPSGLLGGGLVAFVGTLGLVLVSRHYGFRYNFFVFIILLVGGFFLGLVIEMVIRGLIKARS